MFCLVSCFRLCAQNSTDDPPKNLLEAELLGSSYLVPFQQPYTGFFPLTLNYSRVVTAGNSTVQLGIGISTVHSRYEDVADHQFVHPYVHHYPWALCLPVRFLWRYHEKRNGLWGGVIFTPVFVKQQYMYFDGVQMKTTIDQIDYDYQIMPTLCYQFMNKKEHFVIKLLYTPKISSGFFNGRQGYRWKFFPLWGGISIGGAW